MPLQHSISIQHVISADSRSALRVFRLRNVIREIGEHMLLRRMIVADREGHDLRELELIAPVCGNEPGTDPRQPQTPADDSLGHAEPRHDIGFAHAAVDERPGTPRTRRPDASLREHFSRQG